MKLFPKIKNPWPVGLVLFFIVFASYIVGFVIFACRQKMDLVREDYYDQEIRFQKQIDRVQRSAPMLANADINYDRAGDVVTVRLPSVKDELIGGTVSFYRPSDATLDNSVELGLDPAGKQSMSVRSLCAGLWKVRVQWKMSGQEYYFEKPIVIKRTAAS
ncbi:MAG: FixH family protein [Verrucomicrobiota bacterium]|jgi:nitrogen fixation protein FixH